MKIVVVLIVLPGKALTKKIIIIIIEKFNIIIVNNYNLNVIASVAAPAIHMLEIALR